MRFFKRNPEIKETICVCGKAFEEGTVVFGDEYAPFADPKTFPGIRPSLVECNMEEIQKDGEKLDSLKEFEANRVPERPRHSGGTTTANFHMEPEGAKVTIAEPIRTATAPTPAQSAPAPSAPSPSVTEDKPVKKKLDEMYTPTLFASECPGTNDSSAAKILAMFKYPEDLAAASNVDLRTAGVRSNYYAKIRTWAKELG